MNIQRVYGLLLRLYPGEYRERFSAEMWAVFDEAARERRRRGWPAFVCFVLNELAGLVTGARDAWLNRVPIRALPDEQCMRFIISRMEYAIAHHDFPGARFYASEEARLRKSGTIP
jgi:hypothetical protein